MKQFSITLVLCIFASSFLSLFALAATGDVAKTTTGSKMTTETVASGSVKTTTASPQIDGEFVEAVDWMYSYGMTKYRTTKEFKGDELVTREQASKFYTQFAVNVMYKVIDMTKYCEFNDLKDADPSLRNSILTSCLLYLFHGKQNKFSPLQKLSKAEAITVLVRAIDKAQDETTTPRYKNYHAKALELGITKQSKLELFEQPVSRYELALMLYRASKKIKK